MPSEPEFPRITTFNRNGSEFPLVIAGIPAHNEEKTIGKVVENARRFVDLVVVCDDGSTDRTSRVASNFGAVITRHPTNLGYGRAIGSLFSLAQELGARALATLDADSQHDPGSLPSILSPVLNRKADIVIGSRFLRSSSARDIPPTRRLGIVLISKLVRVLSGARISDAQCGYRCYNQTAIRLLKPKSRGMGASTEILLGAIRSNLKLLEVPVRVEYHDGVATSERNPISHFLEVLLTTLQSSRARVQHDGRLSLRDGNDLC